MLVALVGKPSAGKSTFFKSATLAEVEISPRPFTTLRAQDGEAYVKIDCIDSYFKTQCNPRYGFCLNHKRFVPFKLMDVPGLIEKSHEGKGLGNQFLDSLNEADALIHIVDISGSTDKNGNAVERLSHNPEEDIKFLENELDRWYLRVIKKGWDKFSRTVVQENLDLKRSLAKQLSGLRVTEAIAQESLKELNLSHRPSEWVPNDLLNLAKELRKRTKPIIIAANKIDIEGAKYNFEKLKEKYEMILCSAEVELALREAAKRNLIKYVPGENKFEILNENKLNEQQKKGIEFMKKFLDEFNSTGIQDVLNKIVFEKLKYIAVFPGGVSKLEDKDGNVLPDCHLLAEGSTALDFAYRIHKDLGDNFIAAITVKDKRRVGREYKLKNMDVIEIAAKK